MYIPKHFQINDEAIIFDLIEQYSFATLVSQHYDEPFATHLPLQLDKENRALYGHFARANSQWKDAEKQSILVIFQGPHSYISPSWYETTKAVPTWNYVSVHVYGELELINDSEVIFGSLNDLVVKYESPDSTYNLSDVDQHYIEGMSKGIVAFKINITRMEAKAKLSQNHPLERRELIIKQLENSTSQNNKDVAFLMKEYNFKSQ